MKCRRKTRRAAAMILTLILAVCLAGTALSDGSLFSATSPSAGGQQNGNGQYPGSGQQNGFGQPYGGGQYPGSGQQYGGQYPGFGQQYGGGQYPGFGQQYGGGQYPGFGEQYGSGQYPGFGQGNGNDPFGQYGGQNETTLMAMPSARAVRSGEELTLDYDLMLAQGDMERISIIQQGTTLEYTLTYAALDDENRTTDGGSGTVTFSMNREANERCTLALRPEVTENCTLTVKAKMIFSDGQAVECVSDKILVYTVPEVRSHLSAQDCVSGEQLQADFMLIGPEGPWQFTCYLAYSLDGGNSWTRTPEVLTTFAADTRQQEPKATIPVTITAGTNGFCRIEADVVLPDGTTTQHTTDPVRVSAGGAT